MNKFLTLLIFITICSPGIAQENDEQLYEKVFGSKEKERRISIPLFLEKQSLGEVTLFIKSSKITGIDSESLKNILNTKINSDVLNKIPNKKRINTSELPDGMDIILFLDSLYVQLNVPPYFYGSNRISNDHYPSLLGKKVFTQAEFSHILNYWYDFKVREQAKNTHDLNLNSVLNLKGIVIENDFDYVKTEEDNSYSRKSSTITRDFTEDNTRFQIGDLSPLTSNIQTQLTLLGASYSRNYSLNPYKKIKPLNQFEFILEKRSYVTIYVNERPVRSETLDKGRHSIEDLVLDYGRNKIRIAVKEMDGEQREFKFSWAGASELLREDVSLFSSAIGVKSIQGHRNIKYEDSEELTYSGLYQIGLTSLYTLGTFGQLDREQKLLGVTNVYSSLIGNIRLEFGGSEDSKTSNKGITSNLELENSFTTKKGDLRLVFAHEYKSPFYTQFNTESVEQKFLNTFRFDFAWYFNSFLNFSAGYDYQIVRDSLLQDRSTISISTGMNTSRSSKLNLSYQYRNNEFNSVEQIFNIYFNYSFDDQKVYLSTFHDIDNKKHLLQINHSPSKQQDDFYYRARVDKDAKRVDTDLTTGFRSRYFESEVTASVNDGQRDEVNVKVRGAIVTTKDNFAFAPPVYDSFAFVEGVNSLEHKKIGLLNDIGGIGKKEFRNKLFIPQLTSYHYYPIYMDPTHLDLGSSYDFEHFYLYPRYKSVLEVRLGKVKSFTVFGKLNAKALGLKVGELVRADGHTLVFFTNRSGMFSLESVLPGRYDIFVDGKKINKELEIKESDNIILNVGEL